MCEGVRGMHVRGVCLEIDMAILGKEGVCMWRGNS